MIKNDFVKAFLEGVTLTGENSRETLIFNLVGMVFDLRSQIDGNKKHIAYMDDIARENDIHMVCRSCQNKWQPDCELSEINDEGNFCGKDEFCCP